MSEARRARRAADVVESRRKEQISDLQQIMSTVYGRRFMFNTLAITGVYRTSFTGNSETYIREGERNVGLVMLDNISTHCWNDFIKMQQEAKERGDIDIETIEGVGGKL